MFTPKVRAAQRAAMLAKSTPETFWARVKISQVSACWPWTGRVEKNGYGRITYKTQPWSTHRLAWALSKGPIKQGLYVLHKCDNKLCCNPEHLWIGTAIENWTDCVSKGRTACGEKARTAKLSAEAIMDIRQSRKMGKSCTSLAMAYGVTKATISKAVLKRTWKHI